MAEASSLASNIDRNFLECGICFEPFNDPRGLPCLHAFCYGCLEDWAKTCSDDMSIVSCPLCKKVYQIPEEGVEGFPVHFLVTNLKETVDVERKGKSFLQYCKNHDGEIKRYFCENCGYSICSDCCAIDPVHKGHKIIRLKEAARKHTKSLQNLFEKGKEVQQKYEVALQQTEQVEKNLEHAAKSAKQEIARVKNDIIQQLNGLVRNQEQDIDEKKEEMTRKIDQIKDKLQVELTSIKSAFELGTEVVNSRSEYEITSLYPSLSANPQQLIQSQPIAADSKLSHLKFEPAKVQITSIGQVSCDEQKTVKQLSQLGVGNQTSSAAVEPSLPSSIPAITSVTTHNKQSIGIRATPSRSHGPNLLCSPHQRKPSPGKEKARKQWKESRQMTAPKSRYPCGIAIHPNGDIAVASDVKPVTVFSRNGNVKYVLKDSTILAEDIAITPSNQYIIPGKNEFHIYNDQGNHLSTTPTFDVNNKPSRPKAVAVDSNGRIIVGLGYLEKKENNTVSIHQHDGTPISKFSKAGTICYIACALNDELVISLDYKTLQVMDQSGNNARTIQPPPGIRSWMPSYVCCSKQGELFVGNWGDPKAVYRYVSTGGEYKYVDCIISMTCSPYGIALSANEDELFVTNCRDSSVTIFQC